MYPRKPFFPYPVDPAYGWWPGVSGGRTPYGWNPEGEQGTLPPDNPEGEGGTLPPDNPEDEGGTLPPDNPEGESGTLPPDNPRYPFGYYAPGSGYLPAAPRWGYEPGCGCPPPPCGGRREDDEEAVSGPCPGVRPGDYSGFVVVRLDRGVPLSLKDERSGAEVFPESLWALADELGLEALRAAIEITSEEESAGGEEEGLSSAGTATVGGRAPALGFGRRRQAQHPEPGGKGGDGGEEGGEGGAGDGGDEEPFVPSLPPPGTLVSRPLIDLRGEVDDAGIHLAPGRKETLEAIEKLEKRPQVATGPFKPLHGLGRYWRLDLRPYPEHVGEVVERLNALAEVDLAYRELTAGDPQAAVTGESFAEDQGYLDDAPVGIGARWAWQRLRSHRENSGALSLTVCDVEQQWRPEHDGFGDEVDPELRYGANRDAGDEEDGPGNHGNAVLGQLAATGNLRGAVETMGRFVLASHYWPKRMDPSDRRYPFRGTNGHVAAAIFNALLDRGDGRHLEAGDVLLIEVQRGRLPAEVDAADFDAIRLASALGVVVVEAAGNGGVDLDACVNLPDGRSLRRGAAGFRDSGAILVGASRSALPHDRASFSNHGSRLDCFAWGDSVTSCGYGDLAGDAATNYYTSSFSGTSSASPIVAGAAALVQYLHRAGGAGTLGPRALRALLSNPKTGTRQGPNVGGHVGIMPDLEAIVRDELQLVPDVYLRRHVGDDGETPGRQEPVSSSPDLGAGAKPPGEGAEANRPAPGDPLDAGAPLWVRLRNRGKGLGEVDVTLFASPAATLVTPERWWRVGSASRLPAPQGDLLVVEEVPGSAPSMPWPPSPAPAEWAGELPPHTLLAVVRPWEAPAPGGFSPSVRAESVLPPGPPYFDWAEYRAFLRGPGVGWRNVHRLAAGAAAMPFLVAGTPDRTRHFDFEVIQRLPAEAELKLTVPPGLAAKLKQSQPLLSGGPVLGLPRRPRTAIERVCLSAGHCAPARFEVAGATPAAGHSLALRQLWRGEEVGRITWYFG